MSTPDVLASDAERERVAERLRTAAGEGRLTTEELSERLGRVFAARTHGELETAWVLLAVLLRLLVGVRRRAFGPPRR
jgi:hypothetical protein